MILEVQHRLLVLRKKEKKRRARLIQLWKKNPENVILGDVRMYILTRTGKY